jgi:hypothetical protein
MRGDIKMSFKKMILVICISLLTVVSSFRLVLAADILLIQTALPWSSYADTNVLSSSGYTYDIVDMYQVPSTKLSDYQVVLVVNDQNQSFYNYYANNYSYFENYVINGGTLVFFACDHGWAGGDNYTNLPGNVVVGDRYNWTNLISNFKNPIVTQELTNNANRPLNNSDLNGTFTSHNYFVESTLPFGADVVFRTDDSDMFPTLAVYSLGKGKVIASGLTWEYTYDRYSGPANLYGFGRALPDVFKYAFTLARGYQPQGVNILNVYPEDNWVEDHRPITYKHPSDLVDIAVVVNNTSGKVQNNVKLAIEVPADVFDTSRYVEIYRRSSAEELAIKDYDSITTGVQKTINGNKWIISVSGLSIPTQQKWTDFVFRFRLTDTPASKILDNIAATVYVNDIASSSKSLKTYNNVPIKITTKGKIILTNRLAMYRKFAKNANNTLNGDGASKVNQLWETMNKIAGDKEGVIYYVDKYDQGVFDPNDNPTLTWLNDRNSLPYDNDPKTNKEEDQINKVSSLIRTMIMSFIDKSGGIGSGRYVAIVGDDSIIPSYRVWDPTKTVFDNKGSHNVTAVTQTDANNNYLLTDIIYNYDGKLRQEGQLKDIFVGRIVGKNPNDMAKFLMSSNHTKSNSSNVIKLENWKRDGELDSYEDNSTQYGYTVIRDIEGKSIDYMPTLCKTCNWWDLICKLTCESDDPARWSDFSKLFRGTASNVKQFDVFRGMTHGNKDGIYSSEKFYSPYFKNTDISGSSDEIATNFAKYYPFFIYDACLVGLTDGTGNTFINSWIPLNTRGMLASTAITYSFTTGDVSDFNDTFTREFFKSDAGHALDRAEKDASNCDVCSLTSFEMNLYGVPWAKITPPKKGNLALNVLANAQTMNMTQINAMPNGFVENIPLDASNFSVERTQDSFNLVLINGFKLLMQDSQTPVIPYKTLTVDLPLDAVVQDVKVTLGEQESLGQLNIPAYVPPTPVISQSAQSGSYVAAPTTIGIYPATQYNYRVVTHDNKIRVLIDLFPVSYNSATGETIIYKNLNIDIAYDTQTKGILEGVSLNKDIFAGGEAIEANISIQNTSPDYINYQVAIEVRDDLDNIIASANGSIGVNSNSSDSGLIDVPSPYAQGNYKVVVSLSDGQTEIGTYEQMINVLNVKIDYINAPSLIQPNSYGTFGVGINNPSAVPITALVDFYVYDGQHLVTKLPQLFAQNILPGQTNDIETQWYPSADLANGFYTVIAVVLVDGYTMSSESKAFTIINSIRVNGSGYFYPESPTYKATFSMDANGPAALNGWLKYNYAKTRMTFVSTAITSVSVAGNTATINGMGTVNGAAGYTFSATVTDGTPDKFGITIKKSDGTVYYSAGPGNASGGDLIISLL